MCCEVGQRSIVAERVPNLDVGIPGEAESVGEPELKRTPSEQVRAILLRTNQVQQHGGAKGQPRQRPGIRQKNDAAVLDVLLLEVLVQALGSHARCARGAPILYLPRSAAGPRR